MNGLWHGGSMKTDMHGAMSKGTNDYLQNTVAIFKVIYCYITYQVIT